MSNNEVPFYKNVTYEGQKSGINVSFVFHEKSKEEVGMWKEWLKVIIATVFEVLWVIGLTHADQVLEWIGTIIAIFISFYFLIMAGEKIAVGTVYAVFVGLGTVGTVVFGVFFFNEEISIAKIALILLLLTGIIGLKWTSEPPKEESK
ncbi:DMT family transporter [Gracilibacillus orientalis]